MDSFLDGYKARELPNSFKSTTGFGTIYVDPLTVQLGKSPWGRAEPRVQENPYKITTIIPTISKVESPDSSKSQASQINQVTIPTNESETGITKESSKEITKDPNTSSTTDELLELHEKISELKHRLEIQNDARISSIENFDQWQKKLQEIYEINIKLSEAIQNFSEENKMLLEEIKSIKSELAQNAARETENLRQLKMEYINLRDRLQRLIQLVEHRK